jgi:putative membrane protein
MTVHDLPAVNASLNALSAVFIVLGLICIKTERKVAHAVCMSTAIVTSTLFLGCYLTYHYFVGITHFTYLGWPRTLYFSILGTHTPLAMVILPLVIMTVLRAIQARFDSHRRWAKWTVPIWLYVSVTGVLVYMMLYVWFPPVTVVQ